jgi:hypothetical protein
MCLAPRITTLVLLPLCGTVKITVFRLSESTDQDMSGSAFSEHHNFRQIAGHVAVKPLSWSMIGVDDWKPPTPHSTRPKVALHVVASAVMVSPVTS